MANTSPDVQSTMVNAVDAANTTPTNHSTNHLVAPATAFETIHSDVGRVVETLDLASAVCARIASGPVPLLPDSRGSLNARTNEQAQFLLRMALEAEQVGNEVFSVILMSHFQKVSACSVFGASRCGSPVCPRCQARKARLYRRRLEGRMTPDGSYGMLTLTLGSKELAPGHRILLERAAALRRRRIWCDSILGGEAHTQAVLSRGGFLRWNVHFHAIVELNPARPPVSKALQEQWRTLLDRADHAGSLDLQIAGDHQWVHSHYENAEVSKLAFYVSTRKPGHDLPPLSLDDLEEMVRFLSHSRRVNRFGSWRRRRRKLATPMETNMSQPPSADERWPSSFGAEVSA